jgi:hypothetical protein
MVEKIVYLYLVFITKEIVYLYLVFITKEIVYLYLVFITKGGRRIRDRMVVGFTTLWDKVCQ